MGIFKKRGVDVVDLTDMRRRGLLPKEDFKTEGTEMLDFSGNSISSSFGSSRQSVTGDEDFLSSLAGVGQSNSIGVSSSSPGHLTDSLRSARRRSNENAEINELRLKLDDSDFKLRSLTEKIKEIERRLGERGI
jgi:hypothetical protein